MQLYWNHISKCVLSCNFDAYFQIVFLQWHLINYTISVLLEKCFLPFARPSHTRNYDRFGKYGITVHLMYGLIPPAIGKRDMRVKDITEQYQDDLPISTNAEEEFVWSKRSKKDRKTMVEKEHRKTILQPPLPRVWKPATMTCI